MANAYSAASKTRARRASVTPQTKPIVGREGDMTRNSAGGVVFKLDVFKQLDRFLILGSESNTYYASSKTLTADNAKAVIHAIQLDGVRVVNRLVEISVAGRAPKNDPALFVLALALTHGDNATKAAAYAALPQVARIGTHLLHLADYVHGMRSFARGVRKAFGAWYNDQTPMQLAMQMVKYANRDGWTHTDVLRLAHVVPATDSHGALFAHAAGTADEYVIDDDVAEFMVAVNTVSTSDDVDEVIRLITEFQLPREVVPTGMYQYPKVWESLAPHMGMTALVRNLATMTRSGYLARNSAGARLVMAKMADVELVKKSRIHPVQVLSALLTYKSGASTRGTNTWPPNQQIVDALDALFYASFANLVPTGKRIGLFLDVSGSMTAGNIAGVVGLTPRVASAAMAMVTMRTEQDYVVAGFTSGQYGGWGKRGAKISQTSRSSDGITELPILERQRLDDVLSTIDNLAFGATDCSLPMIWALKHKVPIDTFIIYTDNETYAGSIHPSEVLKKYRKEMGIDAKMIVVGMTSTQFTIADPADDGMLDVVGFDSAAPALMADFIRGEV